MKKMAMTSMMAAAAMAIAAGSASAQTMKADIPFTFRVAGAVMQPGTYHVQAAQNVSARYMILRNAETGASTPVLYAFDVPSKETEARGKAMVQFDCAGTTCVLRGLWKGAGFPMYRIAGPRLGRDAQTAQVFMTVVKTD